MACIVEIDNGWLVDNEELLNKWYQRVRSVVNGDKPSAETGWSLVSPSRPQTPYFPTSLDAKTHGKRKCRKHAIQPSNPESVEKYLNLLCLYQELVGRDDSIEYFKICTSQSQSTKAARYTAPCDGLSDLCELSKLALPATETTHEIDLVSVRCQTDVDIFNNLIVNQSDHPLLLTTFGTSYLIPARCQFLMSDVSYLQPLIAMKPSCGYNLIVIDPPWGNGSVRRSKRYSCLQYRDLMRMPIKALAARHALVIVWTTNHPKHTEFVKNTLFPHWSIDYISEWHWMKVTTQGELVIPIESVHRKPYEPMIIGRFNLATEDVSKIAAKKARTDKPEIGVNTDDAQIPQNKVIFSIPTSVHSQKPILSDVMRQYLPKDAKCLELFARNLLPGWTSWGNEVLKFQNTDLYWKENK
ncbi:N(6)-adenine-specific methyltransferase METTL4-like [Corticium candelabrum]|uniref:N(6)-adenine-specific methyltransferase METTL4-like n=1 Tax=Corticium candelabrum TaxID=121492 RepID=UPI002E268053|nr:N(6)-adenine-specific methyltransferase METTL4-like [Corticium candelabrum]